MLGTPFEKYKCLIHLAYFEGKNERLLLWIKMFHMEL